MNLELLVHLFAQRAGGVVELGRVEMLGGVQPLKVTAVQGGGARRFVIATALHCGASCAGIELHVIGVRDGRLERLLERESVDHGQFTIAPDGALEVREVQYSTGDESQPIATKVTRYAVRDGELRATKETTEPLSEDRAR